MTTCLRRRFQKMLVSEPTTFRTMVESFRFLCLHFFFPFFDRHEKFLGKRRFERAPTTDGQHPYRAIDPVLSPKRPLFTKKTIRVLPLVRWKKEKRQEEKNHCFPAFVSDTANTHLRVDRQRPS